MSNWISIKDRVPQDKEVDEWMLVYCEDIADMAYDIATYSPDGVWRALGWDYPVTHWMPLPEPPTA